MTFEITSDAIEMILDGGDYASLKYHIEDTRIFLDSTYTPDRYRGMGIGGKLMSAAIDFAQSKRLSIVPVCPFAIGYFKKHSEYDGLLYKGD